MSLWTDSLALHGEADEDVLADLRSAFPSLFAAAMGADGEDEGDDDADDEDFDDEDDDDSDEEGDDSQDDEDDDDEDAAGKDRGRRKKSRPKTPRERALQDENARRRIKAGKQQKRIEALEAEVARLSKGKGKPAPKGSNNGKDDEDKTSPELEELKAASEKQAKELAKYRRRDAVDSLAKEYKVTDSKMLGYLLADDDIEPDEDGDWPEDIGTKVKRLKRSHPALVGKADDKDDDTEEDDEDQPRRPRVTSTGKGRRRTKKVDEKALAKQFPALAGRLR
jgi:hypothetical protein